MIHVVSGFSLDFRKLLVCSVRKFHEDMSISFSFACFLYVFLSFPFLSFVRH